MIQFANPIWLWGLTGLLIPLGIHLLSRKEGKTIYIGSIRHLRDSNTAQFSSLRLNETLLLLVRCLLLILIVLLLSGMQLRVTNLAKVKWLVIEKGVEKAPGMTAVIDSLKQQGYEAHYLAPGFPDLNDSLEITAENYWLATEALAGSVDEAVVLSFNYSSSFRGKRPVRPEDVRWITVDPGSRHYRAKVVALSPDSVWVRDAFTSPVQTRRETKVIPYPSPTASMTVEKNDSIAFAIVSDDDFDYDKKILLASLNAIQDIIPYKLIISFQSPDQYSGKRADWIIWLSRKQMDITSTHTIGFASCNLNLPLLVRGEEAKLSCERSRNFGWVITKRLNEGSALKDHLTISLAEVLLDEGNLADADRDKRVLPEKLMWSSGSTSGSEGAKTSAGPADPYVAMVLLVILALERMLAYKRNQ